MLGLRIIVEWDGAVVEDRLFRHRPLVLIGAGAKATVPAPGPEWRYVAFVRRGDAWELRVPPGVVRAIEVPGEERVDGAQGCTRALALGGVAPARCGTLAYEGATVSFELVELAGRRGDRALWGWAAAALALALVGGGGVPLVRYVCNANEHDVTDRRMVLARAQAEHLRVRLGPSGEGAARPQGGRGTALHATAPHVTEPTPVTTTRPRPPTVRTPSPTGGHAKVTPEPTRDERIARAEAALLAADLRAAVDDFSRAAKDGPLDYDQLNWLGLAHYMQGEYDAAETAWSQALALDAQRSDAINNLAAVAKRRGQPAKERALLEQALALTPNDCNAANGLALALAKAGARDEARAQLDRSDAACGGDYAYTAIGRAALLALAGDRAGAFAALEHGLGRVDTLTPIKEFEVWNDLTLDPAFASLRGDARFGALLARYLPRAAHQGSAAAPAGDEG